MSKSAEWMKGLVRAGVISNSASARQQKECVVVVVDECTQRTGTSAGHLADVGQVHLV